jgi:hypothetical protein
VRFVKPACVRKVLRFMADVLDTNSEPPPYGTVPVLELADDPLDSAAHASSSRRDLKANPFAFLASFVRITHSIVEWSFGFAVLMVGLATLAALPIMQFLSLGYLLESGGRVARSGRLRDGFIGVRLAARLGGIVLGCWLILLPVRFLSDLAYSAQIIDPDGRKAANWRIGLFVLICLSGLHIGMACARGGRLRYFFWPFNFIWVIHRLLRGGYYSEARDAIWSTTQSLRLPYYFSLGLRGSLGALVWLALPITLIALGRLPMPVGPLVGFLGALLLALVLIYLPILQMRLAMKNRLSAVFEIREVRRDYQRAPWAFAFAFVVTLLFALPLYLLKIEMVPREAAWLPSLVFVLFIFPARLLTGWALGLANRRVAPRHWFFRWTGRLPFLPTAAMYVLIVFFTQYTSWNGVWSLYEQHAFLVPVPFIE